MPILLIGFFLFLCSPLRKSCPRPVLLSFRLVCQCLGLGVLALHCVDSLKQYTLVLELVALGLEVESVIDVLVDFLCIAHLVEKTAEYTCATHPQNLKGETGIGSTTALAGSRVTSLGFSLVALPNSAPRVHNSRLLHDETVLL